MPAGAIAVLRELLRRIQDPSIPRSAPGSESMGFERGSDRPPDPRYLPYHGRGGEFGGQGVSGSWWGGEGGRFSGGGASNFPGGWDVTNPPIDEFPPEFDTSIPDRPDAEVQGEDGMPYEENALEKLIRYIKKLYGTSGPTPDELSEDALTRIRRNVKPLSQYGEDMSAGISRNAPDVSAIPREILEAVARNAPDWGGSEGGGSMDMVPSHAPQRQRFPSVAAHEQNKPLLDWEPDYNKIQMTRGRDGADLRQMLLEAKFGGAEGAFSGGLKDDGTPSSTIGRNINGAEVSPEDYDRYWRQKSFEDQLSGSANYWSVLAMQTGDPRAAMNARSAQDALSTYKAVQAEAAQQEMIGKAKQAEAIGNFLGTVMSEMPGAGVPKGFEPLLGQIAELTGMTPDEVEALIEGLVQESLATETGASAGGRQVIQYPPAGR